LARSAAPGKASASTASELANIIAAPMPWTARAASSSPIEVATAHHSDVAVKIPIPHAKIRLRPSRSASEPAVSTTVARASV